MSIVTYMGILPCVCMAALAAAGAPSSYNMDLASEYTTKIGALEAKVTAGMDRGSTLHKAHRKLVSVMHQLGFVTHYNQVLSSNEKLWGKGRVKRAFQIKLESIGLFSHWNQKASISVLVEICWWFEARFFMQNLLQGKKNNKNLCPAWGTTNLQVEVPTCSCLLSSR